METKLTPGSLCHMSQAVFSLWSACSHSHHVRFSSLVSKRMFLNVNAVGTTQVSLLKVLFYSAVAYSQNEELVGGCWVCHSQDFSYRDLGFCLICDRE